MSDDATLNSDMGAWELFELYREVADTHPTVKAGVAYLLGGIDSQAFRDASTIQVNGVRSLLEAVIEAWSASHGVLFEDAPLIIKELNRLRARTEAKRIHDLEQTDTVRHRDQSVTGDIAILDQPDGIPAVWGIDDEVVWACGEPFLLVSPPGVGKTTLLGQLVRGLLGIAEEYSLLGWPVGTARHLLYVAADRPRQITRSLRRHFTDIDRETLRDLLTIWRGPPPVDFAKHPEALTELCLRFGASHVILDSLKDMAVGLTDDAVGAGLNRAIQLAIAEGIEVGAAHHQRKGQGGAKPKTLEDVYGSTWITAGAGSVVLLWGQAGDLIVELSHLKQPASPIGPLKVEHDHQRGRSTIYRGLDVLAFLRNRGPTGATSADLAKLMFEKSKPTDNDRHKARRKLERLVEAGLAAPTQSPEIGGRGGSVGTVYVATDAVLVTDAGTDAGFSGASTDTPQTSQTNGSEPAGQSTDAVTDDTDTESHRRGPGLPPKPWRVADSCWSFSFAGTLMPSGSLRGLQKRSERPGFTRPCPLGRLGRLVRREAVRRRPVGASRRSCGGAGGCRRR